MLTLITGAPGAGKTAALVSMLADLGKDRQLYVNGIPDLQIPHVQLDEPERWMELVPDGSVIIIDEVQNVWRPQGPGQKIPDHIAKLETHRHRGLDFYIITQGPNLVHANVRALVGRHVHLRDLGFMGRWWYEWPETCDNCRTAWKGAPLKKKYKLPKKIFGSYKSASLHVKPERSFPWMVVVLVVALLVVGVLSWVFYRSISDRMSPPKPSPAVVAPVGSSALSGGSLTGGGGALGGPPDERTDMVPRLSDRPWTASAYDALRTVVRVPYITGAICLNDQCVCYHKMAKLREVSSSACLQWAKDQPFNPYVADETSVADKQSSSGRAAVPPSSTVAPSSLPASPPSVASAPAGAT